MENDRAYKESVNYFNGDELAASVFIAPADTALTRIPFSAPKAAAIYLTFASRDAFATPMTL